MAYSYDAGSAAVATAFGRLVVGSLQSNDIGTFVTRRITGLDDAPEVRRAITDYAARDGDFGGTPYYGGRDILWELVARAANLSDMFSAIQDLKAEVNLHAGNLTCVVEFYGQPAKRFTARLAGVVDVEKPEPGDARRPWRSIAVPLHATDPRLYRDASAHAITIGLGATALTNLGDYPSLPVIRFTNSTGATISDPTVVDAARGRQINLDIDIGAGDYVELDGLNRTAIRSTDGASVRSNVTRWDEMDVPPAGVSWTKTTGLTVVATYRDAWV